MASDTPQYKKGPAADPTQEQLPQGEAQQLNQGTQLAGELAKANGKPASKLAKPGQAQPEDAYVEQPVEYGEPDNSPALPGNDDEQMLFGPTARPMEPVGYGRNPQGKQTPPADLHQWLPALQEAASDPDAPPQFRNLMKALVYHTSQNG